MSALNLNPKLYTPRLLQNLEDIPHTILEHLLDDSILKEKQQEAAEHAAFKMLDEFKRAIALIMPTGTGKTVILARMLAGLKEDEKKGQKPKKILIVTDSEEGVKNTRSELKEFADIDAGVYYSDEKDIEDKQVIVTTYQSWQSEGFPIDPEDVDLTVLDEAHKGISEARLETLEKHDNSLFLALTASPTYDEDRDLLKLFEVAYYMTVPEAVEYGLICSIRNVVLNCNADINLDELAKSVEGFDKALEREIRREAVNREGIEYLVNGAHFDTGQPLREIRGIVSCFNTEHAEDVANKLNEEYAKAHPDKPFKHAFAEFIAGNSKDRDDIIARHRAGETQYLVFADLLNQNYNDKKIGVVFNLRWSDSIVLVIQRAGRSTRIDEEDPDKIALIIDNVPRFKGKVNRLPVLYAHAIGSSSLITHEAEVSAGARSFGFSKVSIARKEDAKAEAKAMQFNIMSDEESILGIFNHYRELKYRRKSNDDLTTGDIARELGLERPDSIRKIFKIIDLAWQVHLNDPENIPVPSVRPEWVTPDKGPPIQVIKKNEYAFFKNDYLTEIETKTTEDMTADDIAKELGLGYRAVLKALKQAKKDRDTSEDKNDIPRVRTVKTTTQSANSIQRKDLSIFTKRYLSYLFARDKEGDDLTASNVAKMLGVKGSELTGLFKKGFQSQLDSDDSKEAIFNNVKLSKGAPFVTIKVTSLPTFLAEHYPQKLEYFMDNREGLIKRVIPNYKSPDLTDGFIP